MNDQRPTSPVAPAAESADANEQAMLGELRSGEAFGNQLIGLVEAQMNGHLESGSVDEWHHKLLDDLVTRAVSVEVLLIEDAGSVRRTQLSASLASAKLAIDELGARAMDAARMVGSAQARVAQAEARLLPDVADTSEAAANGQGGPARLAHVSAQIADLHSAIAATLQRAGMSSLSGLSEAIGSTETQAASVDRRIEEQATRVEQARRALERLESAPQAGSSTHHIGGSKVEAGTRSVHDAGPSEEATAMVEVAA